MGVTIQVMSTDGERGKRKLRHWSSGKDGGGGHRCMRYGSVETIFEELERRAPLR